MLDSIGCSVKIENEVMKVMKDALTLMKKVLSNGLCSLIGSIEYGIAASVVTKYHKYTTNKIVSTNGENFTIEYKTVSTNGSNRTDLWHKRLGHVSEKGLDELYKRRLIGKEKKSSIWSFTNIVCMVKDIG